MKQDLRQDLFSQIEGPFTGEALFDHMTDMIYFIKNAQGQYVVVNQSLVERCACRTKQEIIGLTPDQVYPNPLGESYRAQDQLLLETGQAILNQLELQIYPSGEQGWCLTNKVPIRGQARRIVGLVGVSKDLHAPMEKSEDYTPVARAIQFVHKNFGESFTIADLAAMAGLSAYQFEQRIQKIFEITPGQFIHKVRMDAAVSLLNDTNDPIASVALHCGYADQSTFSRQFKQTVGISPGHYRRMLRE